ncbi:glycosyltransferase family 2 protein [Cryobacterium sp. CG_9.6]|uniref:glycosyltransferase family 2 protein n=1 Tax=Cryobacterium sp. CG_9.6 TaxID=2760710 RepID=UPI0024746642|nr:glycosyltransferase family 2 protein [Cryobacterium sp. CG_9.6]MDH6236820.1 cellulose synthase/poly-beta-1,6-N-acetylglucosamine synthase-like glycosyltransferase [Cryobacterium sp. CG_9.6]
MRSYRQRTRLFNRAVGLVVGAVVAAAALLLWTAVSSSAPVQGDAPSEGLIFGIWRLFYDLDAPAPRVLLAAVALAFLFAAGVAIIEIRVSNKSRRSFDLHGSPLAPKVIMAATRGAYDGPVTVTVLIPAHNEEASLQITLTSILAQSHRPARVIVVADNCTDGTVAVARQHGVEVVTTINNTAKKAGALNQVLARILPDQGPNNIIMVLDADTAVDDGFLAAAVSRFENDRGLMAVGGLFYGEPGSGLLGQLQRNEYVRYSTQIGRRRGRVFVLTGTASLFRSTALRTVAANRGVTIPGITGDVYDTAALTEDNELTLALKSLGALIISPAQCTVVTEVMPTARALWVQRLRWQRGALENLGAYGITPSTFRYWAQQLGIGYSVIALSAFVLLIVITVLAVDAWVWFPFWLGLGIVFTLERVVSVWAGGWRARLLAAALVPELIFDMFLDLVYVQGIIDITRGRTGTWGHVNHGSTRAPTPILGSGVGS